MRGLFWARGWGGFGGEAVHGPLGVWPGPQPLVEADRVAVPVEHRPLEAAALALDRQARELFEERPSDAPTAMLRGHEEVLEVDPGLRQERREVVKEEGEPDGRAILVCDQRLRVVVLSEEIGRQPLLGHGDLVLQLLVAGQAADQLGDHRNVRALPGSDEQRHLGRSRSRNTRRIAPCVSEKLAILLSTRPAARVASMTSVSRISGRPPFGRTTRIAPFGSIQRLTSLMRSRSASLLPPMKTRSTGPRGRPFTTPHPLPPTRPTHCPPSRSPT